MADNKAEVREAIASWLEREPERCIDPTCSRCVHALEFAADIRDDKWSPRKLRKVTLVPSTIAPEKLDIPGTLIVWAKERGLKDPRTEVDHFLAWHRAKQTKSKDWLEVLKIWLLNQKKFADEKGHKGPPKRQEISPVQRLSLEERQKLLNGNTTSK